MIYTYRDIGKITFPIYRLPSDNWHRVDGLVMIDEFVLDDTNMPGDNIGMRRLLSPMKSLFPLKKGSYSIVDVLKFGHFIDFSGKTITYVKSKYSKLKYLRIYKVELKDTGSLVWLMGVSFPFVLPRPPPHGAAYARVLYLNDKPWLIYEFTREIGKDTRRMV